jgi:hypothetical protein
MAGRVTKSQHPKTKEGSKLSEYIALYRDRTMPCSRCFRQKLPCVTKGDQSSCCGNCVDAKVICDGAGVASYRASFGSSLVASADRVLVTRNMKECKKLEKEEQEAEEALEKAMARLAWIRKMKRRLKQQGDELFARGMQSLEDAEDSAAVQAESLAISDVQSLGAVDLTDWASIFADVPSVVDENSSPVSER